MIGLISGVCALVVAWMITRRALRKQRAPHPCAKVPVSAAMSRRFHAVRSDDALGTAAHWLVETGHDLPIVDDGAAVGVLTRCDVVNGITHAGEDAPISRAPHHRAITVAASDSVEGVAARLAKFPDAIAVVVDGERPVGVVTPAELATYVALHERPEAR